MWRRELGIELKLVIMENRSVLAARRSGDYQILVSTWTGDYADPRNFLEIWSKDSGNNFTGWSDSAFESLFAQSTKTQDVEKRYTLLAASENILLEASPCIPIYHFKHAYLLQPSVHGWNKNLLDHHPYKGVWLEMR
jgi:oligopeptide transport system substrate-binding protein